ncbi:MAG: DUF5676 family membrane protein [Patescibacteria group bacterium]
MELDKNKFSIAASATMGIVYVVCAVFVALWPDFTLKLFGWLAHLVNVDKFAGDVRITALGFTMGLLQAVVYTYVGAFIFVWLHNRSIKSA